MDDRLREELATLGQRIELAEYERRLAVDEVREILVRHHAALQMPQVSQLTTLSQPTLGAMIIEDWDRSGEVASQDPSSSAR